MVGSHRHLPDSQKVAVPSHIDTSTLRRQMETGNDGGISCCNTLLSVHCFCANRWGKYHVVINLTELCKSIPAKFREAPSNCSAARPKNALECNFSAIPAENLAECFHIIRYSNH